MQYEIIVQALSNLGLLCIPGVLSSYSTAMPKRALPSASKSEPEVADDPLHPIEFISMITWVIRYMVILVVEALGIVSRAGACC